MALTLLVGIVGAIVLATVAGARRSDSALARFNAYSHSSSLELTLGRGATPAQLRAFTHAPGVASVAMVYAYALTNSVGGFQNLAVGAAVDDKLGRLVDRARLISGRRANLSAPDEVTLGEGLAKPTHLGVGDHLAFESYTPA
ncbi:MAG: hypothetical protein JWL83_2252, partial [Actinomycetia bacterium]|nr:hypothetical protein [Actinomycetes bacterium]